MNGVILITGCNSGIGAQTARLFLEKGWTVIATIYPQSKFNELKGIDSASLHTINVDITKKEDREKLSSYIEQNVDGQVDCLVNNAGIREQYPFELLSEEDISSSIAVNFTGTCLLTKSCLKYVIAARGRIIFLSSIAGFIPIPMGSVYAGCKHGIEAFAQSLSMELKNDKVQICTVQPGAHETPINHVFHEDNLSTKNKKVEKAICMAKCLVNKNLPPPINVAKKILNLVQMDTMPLKVRVGSDAKYHYYIDKIVPRRIWLKLHMIFIGFCSSKISS